MGEARIAVVDFLSCPRCDSLIVDDGSFVVRKFRPNRHLEIRYPLCRLCGVLPDFPCFVGSSQRKAFSRFKFFLSYGAVDYMDLWEPEHE